MNGLIGHGSLLVSVVVIVLGIGAGVMAGRLRTQEWINAAYSAVYTNFALVTIATGAMVVALVTHDFSVSYVAQVGSRATPPFYTIISLWSALEGSILFWGWVLSLYAAVVVWGNRRRAGVLVPWSATALLSVSLFFAILLIGPANPFHLVYPVAADGPAPNPLIKNHILRAGPPPLLYLGYVGMTVPFAFAVGAM